MTVFEDHERAFDEGAARTRSTYQWLDESTHPEAERIRALYNCWFKEHPDSDKERMLRQLRSNESHVHEAAFFELLLYRVLKSTGHAVAPEYKLAGGSTPDFLVEIFEGEQFIVEATSTTGLSKAEQRSERLWQGILKKLEEIRLPSGVHLIVWRHGMLMEQPAPRGIANAVAASINNMLSAMRTASEFEELPPISLGPESSLRISFGFYDGEAPPIVAESLPTPADAIRQMTSTLKRKSGQHRSWAGPYVVALNARDIHTGHGELWEALFGPRHPELERDESGEYVQRELKRHGGFIDDQHTSLSGVLFVTRAHARGLDEASICFVPNPWARHPLRASLGDIPIHSGTFLPDEHRGNLGQMLGLDPKWLSLPPIQC